MWTASIAGDAQARPWRARAGKEVGALTAMEWLDRVFPPVMVAASLALMGIALAVLLMRAARSVRACAAEGAGWRQGGARAALDRLGPSPTAFDGTARTMLCVAAIAIASRLLLYAASWGMDRLHAGITGAALESFAQRWIQWDAFHYLDLADNWYVAEGNERLRLVFFPLFPLLIRGVRWLVGDTLTAACALNVLCTGGCACVLYGMVAERYGAEKARLSVAYFLLNPFSVFLGAPFSEALFLLCTLGALWLAGRGRFLWAGALGALSASARMLGLIVVGAIALEGVPRWLRARTRRGRVAARALAGAGVVALGFAAYLLLNVHVSGAPFTFLTYQRENWSQQAGFFWQSVKTTAAYLLSWDEPREIWGVWLPQLVSMLAVMFLLAWRGHRLPFAWAAYAWVYVAAALSPTWLLSGARYLMALAPLPVLQALTTERRGVHCALLAVQAALLLLVTYAYGTLQYIL